MAEKYHSNPFASTMDQLSILVKTNPISSLTLGALIIGIVLLGILVAGFLESLFNSRLGDIVVFIGVIVYAFYFLFRLTAASYYLHMASREGRTLTAKQAITEVTKKNYGQYLITIVLANVFILVGFVALVFPGIYLLGRLSLAPYIALNENLDAMKSLKRSWELSEGHWFEIVGAMVASGITIASGMLLGVGAQSGLAGRYFELSELKKIASTNHKTHWMNYLLVGLAVVGIGFYALVARATIYNNINDPTRCTDTYFAYSIDCTTVNPDPAMDMHGMNDPNNSFDNLQSPAH